MKLNNLDLESYAEHGNEVTFILPGTVGLDDVMALDGEALAITSNGADYRRYEGYSLMSAGYTDQSMERVSARFFRALSDQTEAAIVQLDANHSALVQAVEDGEAALAGTDADLLQAVGELGVAQASMQQTSLEILQAVGELGAMVAAIGAPTDAE